MERECTLDLRAGVTYRFARVIDGPPQPAALTINHQTEFVKVPDVRARAPRAPQSSSVLRTEPQRPEADAFVRDLNPSGQHQLGDVYGADLAAPTPWFTLKAEAAYVSSGNHVGDDYVLCVLQLERQSGEWVFVGGTPAKR
jgi:hypothetical protein